MDYYHILIKIFLKIINMITVVIQISVLDAKSGLGDINEDAYENYVN